MLLVKQWQRILLTCVAVMCGCEKTPRAAGDAQQKQLAPVLVVDPVAPAIPKPILTELPAAATRADFRAIPGDDHVRKEIYYLDNKWIATRCYGKDEEIFSETLYRDGKKEGLERYWYKNGQLRSEHPYKNDKLHGTCRWWDNSGKIARTFEMTNGNGTVKRWYQDGTLEEEAQFRNGLVHGLSTQYYPNGKKHYECGKSEGRSHGLSFAWDVQGMMIYQSPHYFVRGLETTREGYAEALAEDPTLPPLPK